MQELGAAFGVAVLGSVLAAAYGAVGWWLLRTPSGRAHVVPAGQAASELTV